jgi:hypothetical protein
MPVKVTKTIEIANGFLEQIRLPNAEIVSSDIEFANSYAIVAQFINNLIKNKENNDFIAGKIAEAILKNRSRHNTATRRKRSRCRLDSLAEKLARNRHHSGRKRKKSLLLRILCSSFYCVLLNCRTWRG